MDELKRGPGRPRKYPEGYVKPKKPVGRPRKHPKKEPKVIPADPDVQRVISGADQVEKKIGVSREEYQPEGEKKFDSAMDFLGSVMNDDCMDIRHRLEAAKSILPYQQKKLGDLGKKEAKQAEAEKVAGGKFAAAARPPFFIRKVA
jgi:phage terminase small subunit